MEKLAIEAVWILLEKADTSWSGGVDWQGSCVCKKFCDTSEMLSPEKELYKLPPHIKRAVYSYYDKKKKAKGDA